MHCAVYVEYEETMISSSPLFAMGSKDRCLHILMSSLTHALWGQGSKSLTGSLATKLSMTFQKQLHF